MPLQQNSENANAGINTTNEREKHESGVETEPEIEKENSLKQCREWSKNNVEQKNFIALLNAYCCASFIHNHVDFIIESEAALTVAGSLNS